MDEKCMEWYRFKSSKFRSGVTGFFIGLILIIIIDQLLIQFNLFDNTSDRDLYYIELIDLEIMIVSMIWGYFYTYVRFGLSDDTLFYVKYGRIKGSYNIYNCKFERDYKTRRLRFTDYYIKQITSRIRITVETEQGERHILKGTGFSAITFDNLFERMEELKQYKNGNQNGKFMLPQQIFRKQLIHQSWVHIFDGWKTPWKIEFAGSLVSVDKHTFLKDKINSIKLITDGTVRKLVIQLKDGEKKFYLGCAEDTILDTERMQYEIHKFMK